MSRSAPGLPHPRRLLRLAPLALVILVLLALSLWSATAYWQLQRAQNEFAAGDYPAVEAAGERFTSVSPFEKHKGHFATGTARAAAGELDSAEDALSRALDLTPVTDECAIRQNLALVQEAQAEEHRAAEDTEAADERYDTARTTLTEAPEECRPDGSDQDARMDRQADRIGESQEQMHDPEAGGDDESDDGGGSEDEGSAEENGAEGNDDTAGEDEGSGAGSDEDRGEGQDGRMDELREREQEADRHYSESNSGEGSGVREPGVKPW